MSREQILANVRHALRQGQAPQAAAHAAVQQRLHACARAAQLDWTGEPLTRFLACAQALSSSTGQVANLADVPTAVAGYVQQQSLLPDLVGWSTFAALPWAAAGLQYTPRTANADDLIGLTGCFCAIAETGTLLLLSSADTPAATSLLPETHVAIVPARRIVRTMEDAFALVRAEVGALPRALNFISGPSRTADIEQTVTLGAHGPYRVHLLIVENA